MPSVTHTDPHEGARRRFAAAVAFEDEVAVAAGAVNAADGALVALTAKALDERYWEGWRIHSPTQWLCWRAGVSRHKATRIVGVARRATELPTVMRLLGEGRLSLDQAAAVARYTPASYEASVCELALSATVAQIVAATRQYGFDADAREADPAPAAPERSVTFGTDGAQWSGRVRLPADEGVVVEAALQAARDRLHDQARSAAKQAARDEGRPSTGSDADLGVAPVSWADALVGLAKAELATGATGAEAATRVGVLVHLEAPADDTDADHWRAELHRGPTLPPSLRRFLTCDGDVQPVWHRDGHPVQVGRSARIVPRRVRRLVEHRDRGCRVPGCDTDRWIEVHHIIHWEDDGETVTWNLLCLCSRHHRMHHMGHLGIAGDADLPLGAPGAVEFTDARGSPLAAVGRSRPPDPGTPPSTRPYRCPTGERLQRRWIEFTATTGPPAGVAS